MKQYPKTLRRGGFIFTQVENENRYAIGCDGCEAYVANGIPLHEAGCSRDYLRVVDECNTHDEDIYEE